MFFTFIFSVDKRKLLAKLSTYATEFIIPSIKTSFPTSLFEKHPHTITESLPHLTVTTIFFGKISVISDFCKKKLYYHFQ